MSKKSTRRSRELALIHIGKKELGWDDDTYRDALLAWTGKTSSGKMTTAERSKVIEGMKELGFRPERTQAPPEPVVIDEGDAPVTRKIKTLWRELHREGAVENPSLQSLNRFCIRITRDEHVDFLSDKDAQKMIEVLKSWLARVRREKATE